jgi:hypothetical protein
MKYRLEYDDGKVTIEASSDGEAQSKARQFLKDNFLLPQRRRNYLYRYTLIKRNWVVGVLRSFSRWVEIPF